MSNNFLKVAISACFALAIFFFNFFFSSKLFNYSIDIIASFQTENYSRNSFWIWIISSLSLVILVAFSTLHLAYSGPKPRLFLHFFCIFLTISLTFLIKLIFADIRPYWTDQLSIIYPEYDFGNPSAHSSFSLAILLSWNFLCINERWPLPNKYVWNEQLTFFYTLKAKIITNIFGIILTAIVLFSRFYFGAHSIDQILFGSFIAIFVFLNIHILFFEEIIKHLYSFFDEESFQNYQKYIRILWIIILSCLPVIDLGLFLGRLNYKLTNEEMNHIQKYVPNITDSNFPCKYSLLHSTLCGIILGSYLGMHFNSIFFHETELIFQNFPTFRKNVLRLIIFFSPGIAGLLIYFLGYIVKEIMLAFFFQLLGLIVGGFCIFGFGDNLCKKLGLHFNIDTKSITLDIKELVIEKK